MEDLFNTQVQPYIMSQKEYFEKTKAVLDKIVDSYSKGWKIRFLRDGEHPEESVCDECTGCGLFFYNGEEKECFRDTEQGDCFHRFCDYEQVGMDLESCMEDIFGLSAVDEIVHNKT